MRGDGLDRQSRHVDDPPAGRLREEQMRKDCLRTVVLSQEAWLVDAQTNGEIRYRHPGEIFDGGLEKLMHGLLRDQKLDLLAAGDHDIGRHAKRFRVLHHALRMTDEQLDESVFIDPARMRVADNDRFDDRMLDCDSAKFPA